MELGLLEFETRRNIKPGDIFRAHLVAASSTTGAGAGASVIGKGMPEIDQILAAGNRVELYQPVAPGGGAEAGMFRGHDAFSARTKTPYNWGVSLQQSSLHKPLAQERGELEHMERLQIGVMDAIHDALSKEALVKKLILPFNETFETKHAVSHWEWQKNAALLELEQRNQQLQHRLREAAKQVMEAQCMAQHDRKRLEEALQKGKEELYLIGRAEAMRTRLIEQKKVIARSHTLKIALFSWQRFCQNCRKKRTLKKSEFLWHRLLLTKHFDDFVNGYESIRHYRQLKDRGWSHWVKKSLRRCLQSWLMRSQRSKEVKNKVKGFDRTWNAYRLQVAYEGWQETSSGKRWKQIQQKRAAHVWSFSQLRKAWQGWNRHVVLAKDKIYYAEDFLFQKLVGDCFSGWWRYLRVKLHRSKQWALCIKLRESRLHQIAFDAWIEKTSLSTVVRGRLTHFVKRCERRLQQFVLTKWHQLVLRTRYLRSVQKVLRLKAMFWSKRWAFLELKRRWIGVKVVQRSLALRIARRRLALFWTWRAKVQCWKDARARVVQIRKRVGQRQQHKLFTFWVIYTAMRRKFAVAKAASTLAARVQVLETELHSAERVRHQLDKLVLEFENEKTTIINSAQAAIVRTPVWTSGFLDAELRWRSPSLSWLPPACAGHTAVSLPGKHGTYSRSRVLFFGGYNGKECFNHVLIFDTDEMQWKAPAPSAAEGSVIPPAMQTHTSCAFGKDKMILFGGYDGAQEFSEVSVLTISKDSLACEWLQLQFAESAKPGPVCQHTSCLYEDGPYMVVFGGYRSRVGLLNEVWVLDLHWLHWTCPEYFGTPPVPSRGHGAVIIGKKMYIFGGYNGREHLADLHALDIETMTWESIEGQGQGPSPRRQHSIAVVGQHLIVYGGYDGQQYLGDVFSFDTIHRRWKQWPDRETKLPFEEVGQGGQVCGRSMHTMVDAGQRLVVFGGVHEWGALQDMVFLENAAAIDGLHLQTSFFEELQKVTKLQAQITEYEKVHAENTTELATTQTTLGQLRSTLQVESEKRKRAVRDHRVLTRKLQKARAKSASLSQTCNRLRKEVRQSEAQDSK